ncbi:MAG: hypothetical protein ACK56F_29950, partial [bacterium]
ATTGGAELEAILHLGIDELLGVGGAEVATSHGTRRGRCGRERYAETHHGGLGFTVEIAGGAADQADAKRALVELIGGIALVVVIGDIGALGGEFFPGENAAGATEEVASAELKDWIAGLGGIALNGEHSLE